MKIIKEFKEFAIKGNVFDMAIGIIIGTAFSKVVTSLVNDIIMPPIGFLINNVNFKELSFTIQPRQIDDTGKVIQELIAINYGNFLQLIIDFLIVSLCIFLIIKVFNRIRQKSEDIQDATVPTPKDIELLTDIRNLLKNKA